MEKKQFTYFDSKNVERTVELSPEDFTFVQENITITDKAMKTKPTTFFRDAMRRFAKNKSSVAGAIILGSLVVLTIVLPFALPSDIDTFHPYEKFLAPKLFDSGTGWWDGSRSYQDKVIDFDWDHYDETGELTGFPADFEARGVVGGQSGIQMTAPGEKKVDAYSPYARGGYVRLSSPAGTTSTTQIESPSASLYTSYYQYDLKMVTTSFTSEQIDAAPASYALYFVVTNSGDPDGEVEVKLKDFTTETGEVTLNLNEIPALTTYSQAASGASGHFTIRLDVPSATRESTLLLKSFEVVPSKGTAEPSEMIKEAFEDLSIHDAIKFFEWNHDTDPTKYWTRYSPLSLNVYQADIVYGNFRYDTYEVAYGDRIGSVTYSNFATYVSNKWIVGNDKTVDEFKAELVAAPRSEREALCAAYMASLSLSDEGKLHCPLRLDVPGAYIQPEGAGKLLTFSVIGTISGYRVLGYTSMPRYLMGTDSSGRDLVHYAFAGLRTSLVLGVIAAAVCFGIGLVWGAISGYFGGWVDIWMERFCEILGGLPWIVLMTFMMLKFGQNLFVFAAAICLTGWMGTAHLTRTQFYRFKDREYILAARTLGARDGRLIFRHILPNAVGTIVTASVLMIPSTIFSEATIAYLGLGLKGVASFGVMLSDNQPYLEQYPSLILFPSAIMALMMISFNLFGNGLRDAFNPSLKGQE